MLVKLWSRNGIRCQRFRKQREINSRYSIKCACLTTGMHLLTRFPDKTVRLVESPKNAILGAMYYPQYLWLSTGNKGALNSKTLAPLKGRNVTVFPDREAISEWRTALSKMSDITSFQVDEFCDRMAPPSNLKYDVADFIISSMGVAAKWVFEWVFLLSNWFCIVMQISWIVYFWWVFLEFYLFPFFIYVEESKSYITKYRENSYHLLYNTAIQADIRIRQFVKNSLKTHFNVLFCCKDTQPAPHTNTHPQRSLPRIALHLAYHLHLLRGETPRESGISWQMKLLHELWCGFYVVHEFMASTVLVDVRKKGNRKVCFWYESMFHDWCLFLYKYTEKISFCKIFCHLFC